MPPVPDPTPAEHVSAARLSPEHLSPGQPLAGHVPGEHLREEHLRDEDLPEAEVVAEVDALPVLAPERVPAMQRARRALARDLEGATIPAVQAAAVAAGSFVAGAAVAGLVHRRHRGRVALAQGARTGRALQRSSRKSAGEVLQVVGRHTMLVDVHVLGTPGADR